MVHDSLSSGFLNIDLTCLICGSRSGAERNSPRIVLDWNVSEASASSDRPILSDLKACIGQRRLSSGAMHRMRNTYSQDFQEVLHFAVLCVDTRDNTLEVRKAFRDLRELSFECRMVEEILDSVEPEEGV